MENMRSLVLTTVLGSKVALVRIGNCSKSNILTFEHLRTYYDISAIIIHTFNFVVHSKLLKVF